MNLEVILLKAQLEALRNYYVSSLATLFSHDEEKNDKVWLAKYFLWRFERENLSSLGTQPDLDSPEKEVIIHRCFQLEVLMDVAYIQGDLEGYDVTRVIFPHHIARANDVFEKSDGSEESMISIIDKLYK